MRDIWLMRPDGSDNHPITHGTRDSAEGRMHFDDYVWSPDSERLSTVGWRLDSLGVALRRHPRELKEGTNGGTRPGTTARAGEKRLRGGRRHEMGGRVSGFKAAAHAGVGESRQYLEVRL